MWNAIPYEDHARVFWEIPSFPTCRGVLFLSMLGITALLLHFKESLGSILDAKGKIFGFPMVYLGPALFSCRLQQKVGLGDSLLIGIVLLMFADVGVNIADIAEYLDGAH